MYSTYCAVLEHEIPKAIVCLHRVVGKLDFAWCVLLLYRLLQIRPSSDFSSSPFRLQNGFEAAQLIAIRYTDSNDKSAFSQNRWKLWIETPFWSHSNLQLKRNGVIVPNNACRIHPLLFPSPQLSIILLPSHTESAWISTVVAKSPQRRSFRLPHEPQPMAPIQPHPPGGSQSLELFKPDKKLCVWYTSNTIPYVSLWPYVSLCHLLGGYCYH